MGELDRILQDSASFLKDVSTQVSDVLLHLKIESNREIMEYHPLTNGHMLRPLLVYITANSFLNEEVTQKRNELITFAACVELMHNASLLHDDLLDEEEIRRQKPCLYKAFGFKNGLLAGNIFYIKAIELSSQMLSMNQTKDLLDSAIAMCEGELLQARYEKKQMSKTVYDKVVRYKTGALTALACRQSAKILQADEDMVQLFGNLGEELGVLYQLIDDRKDQDANLESTVDIQKLIEQANEKIISYMQELSHTKKMESFEEILLYFCKK